MWLGCPPVPLDWKGNKERAQGGRRGGGGKNFFCVSFFFTTTTWRSVAAPLRRVIALLTPCRCLIISCPPVFSVGVWVWAADVDVHGWVGVSSGYTQTFLFFFIYYILRKEGGGKTALELFHFFVSPEASEWRCVRHRGNYSKKKIITQE